MKQGIASTVVFVVTTPFVLACMGGKFAEERAACDEYIACADAVDSTATPTNEMAYGDDSACWNGKDEAELCADACVTATVSLADATGEEACGGDGTTDTNDTNDTNTGGLLIISVDGTCSPSTQRWTYTAETNGWTTDGLLEISQDVSDPWDEQHDIVSVSSCEDGSCDNLERQLAHVESYADQRVNQSTLYDCTNDRAASMMWMIQVFDLDDNMADCVVWGADVSVFSSYGCENANNW